MAPHAQLFRDALHALSLGSAAFALFGDADIVTRIAYIMTAFVLHVTAHGVIALSRKIETQVAKND